MKIRQLSRTAALALGVFGAFGAQAQTNLLSDGDFESFTANVGSASFTTINAGSQIGAWSVTGASVDLVRNAYGSINDISVDLAGTPGPGYISQTFSAVAGTTYTLSWDQFRNGSGATADMVVSLGGSDTNFSAVSTVTHGSLSWTAAADSIQSVKFGTATNSVAGPTLDNVTLTAAVPEPATGALLLAGIACIGWVARRRS
ncbi:MAG TPA: DUF642 domain-containing protein [Burkholderiaceae bacterium]|jgi:hypothetical protein